MCKWAFNSTAAVSTMNAFAAHSGGGLPQISVDSLVGITMAVYSPDISFGLGHEECTLPRSGTCFSGAHPYRNEVRSVSSRWRFGKSELLAQGVLLLLSLDQQIWWARDEREFMASLPLEDIADAKGDVDDWIFRQQEKSLDTCWFAKEAGKRLMEAGREKEALRVLEMRIAKRKEHSKDSLDESLYWDGMMKVHRYCLNSLGRKG